MRSSVYQKIFRNTECIGNELLSQRPFENSSATTNEMSKVIEDLSKGAVSQAEEIEEASVHIGEMGHVIEEIVSSVDGLG